MFDIVYVREHPPGIFIMFGARVPTPHAATIREQKKSTVTVEPSR